MTKSIRFTKEASPRQALISAAAAARSFPNGDWAVGFVIVFDGTFAGSDPQYIMSTGGFQSGGSLNVVFEPPSANNVPGYVHPFVDTSNTPTPKTGAPVAAGGAYVFVLQRSNNVLSMRHCPLLSASPSDSSSVVIGENTPMTMALNGSGSFTIAGRSDLTDTRHFGNSLARFFRLDGQTLTDLEVAKLAYGMEITDLGKTPSIYVRGDGAADTADRGSQANTWDARGTPTDGATLAFGYTPATGGGSTTPTTPAPVTPTLTANEVDSERIFQRINGAANVPMSGGWTGSAAPAKIEYQLLAPDATTVQKTWADSGATINSNGTWSANPSLPQPTNAKKYKVQYRSKDSSGTVLVMTAVKTNRFGVGDIIGCVGSSSAEKWFQYNSGGGFTPNYEATSRYDGVWNLMSSDGCATQMANDLVAKLGVPIAMLDYGIGGSTLGNWNTNGYGQWNDFATGVAAVGGKLAGVMSSVGSNDASYGQVLSRASHLTNLRSFVTRIRNLTSQAALPILVSGFNRRTNYDATLAVYTAGADYVRMAENDIGDDPNVYHVQTLDFELSGDGIHLTPNGFIASGVRNSYVFGAVLAGQSYLRGPKISSINVSGNTATVKLTHRGSTDFTPTANITGFTALDSSGAAVNITSVVRTDASTITLNCASAPAKVQYLEGGFPPVGTPVFGNTSTPLPMVVETDLAVTVASSPPVSRPEEKGPSGMKLIDLHKQNATISSAATINLGAAVSGFRTIAQAIAADVNDPFGLRVGDKGVMFIVRDPATGAFEFAAYTVTSATVLTRERVYSSTNGNAPVAFNGAVCEVYSSMNGAIARKFDMGTSVRTVYTSSVCPDDGVTDLAMTPTTGASMTATLQKLFDLNNDGTPLRVIWDSKYSLDSASTTYCLLLNSNTEIVALPGCGAVMRTNQPTSMFRNRNPVVIKDGSAVSGVIDRNISIKGGIWHGNQDNQSVRETAATGGIFLFDFMGVDNLNMSDGIEWRRPVSFAFRGTNVSNVLLQNFFVNFGMDNTKLNSDGIHFNGPAQHLRLLDGRIYGCADDSLSFTANDIFLAPGNYGPFGGVYGPITDVTVDNMEIHSVAAGIRLLSSFSRMDRFSISNIKGDFGGNWLVIDNFTENPNLSLPNGDGNIGTIMIRDIQAQNHISGNWPKKGAYLNCKVERLIFDGVHREYFENEFFPAIWFGPRFRAKQILIENYTSMNNNGGTYVKDQIFFDNGCQIDQVKIKGAMFHSNIDVNGCPVAIEAGASISQFVLDDCQGSRFTDFVRKSGTVTNFHVGTNCYMDGTGNVLSTWNLQSGSPWSEDPAVPNKLAYIDKYQSVVSAAIKKTLDGFSGNAVLSADIKFSSGFTPTSPMHAALALRASNIPPWASATGKAYGLDISAGESQVKIIYQNNGSDSIIGTAVTLTIPAGVAFRYFLSAKTNSTTGVTTLVAKVKRLSDGNWLSGSNTWSATEVAAITATDSRLPAVAGGWGFYAYNEYVVNGLINIDNIDLSAA